VVTDIDGIELQFVSALIIEAELKECGNRMREIRPAVKR
jgi:hypothetical protein